MPVVKSGRSRSTLKSPADRAKGEKKTPGKKKTKGSGGKGKDAPKKKQIKIPGAAKIQIQDLPSFSRQLAAMLSAGMPIVASLEALEEQTGNPHFKPVIARVKGHIENGAALSEAMGSNSAVFDELYVNMVRGGESGGQLAETIDRLAGFLENSAKLRRKVKGAMMYPIIVLCIAISISIGMIMFIVPVFADMFADFGADLPGPTRFLMNLSDSLRAYGIYIFGACVVAAVTFSKWKATPNGALVMDGVALKAPVMGELVRKIASARFARTFSQLIRSGVPILGALEIVSGATGNKVAGNVISDARDTVERGDSLSSAMLTQTVFPSMLVRMLSAGEKTGKIDEMMDNIADFYEDEVETALGGLTSMIEPLLMIFMGVVVGFILVAMFMPMFKLGQVVSGGF